MVIGSPRYPSCASFSPVSDVARHRWGSAGDNGQFRADLQRQPHVWLDVLLESRIGGAGDRRLAPLTTTTAEVDH